jgi:acid phosphatase family membrane protein YuiD
MKGRCAAVITVYMHICNIGCSAVQMIMCAIYIYSRTGRRKVIVNMAVAAGSLSAQVVNMTWSIGIKACLSSEIVDVAVIV